MADTDTSTISAVSPRAHRPLRGKVNVRPLILFVVAWLVLLAIVLLFDARISTWFDAFARQDPVFLRVMKLSRYLFSTWVYVALAAALLLRQDRWRALVGFAVPVGACFGTVHLLKFVIGRARPDRNFGPFHFDLFGSPFAGLDGLPSAHTAAAVLLTALLFRYFRPSAWLLIPAAVLASLSRVAQGALQATPTALRGVDGAQDVRRPRILRRWRGVRRGVRTDSPERVDPTLHRLGMLRRRRLFR